MTKQEKFPGLAWWRAGAPVPLARSKQGVQSAQEEAMTTKKTPKPPAKKAKTAKLPVLERSERDEAEKPADPFVFTPNLTPQAAAEIANPLAAKTDETLKAPGAPTLPEPLKAR